jgi:purine-nucleoside phosphorylase
VYGAARAVEPVHIFGELGTPVVVQIGSCGSLQPGVATGDIVLPEVATIGEGASQYYGGSGVSTSDPTLVDRAAAAFEARGFRLHRGPQVTTSALLAQPPALVDEWHRAGHLAVDMETSAVFTAAKRFGMAAVSLLFVWDELLARRSFLHTFTPEEQAAQLRANAALMDVALELVP